MMNGINPPGIAAATAAGREKAAEKAKKPEPAGLSFKEMLSRQAAAGPTGELNFSKHAQARTEQRGIALTQEDMARLGGAVGKARDKGLADALVFMDNTAYIVNVPNRTVVTVIDGKETDNTVFTNIDGAVIV